MAVETVQVPRPNPRPPGAEDMAARRIAYERERRGWSTAELARRMTEAGVPVNQSAIYKIEKGTPRRTISLDEARALAQIFGLSSVEELATPVDTLRDLLQLQTAIERAISSTNDAQQDLISLARDLLKRWSALRAAESPGPDSSARSGQTAKAVIDSLTAIVNALTEARDDAAQILRQATSIIEDSDK